MKTWVWAKEWFQRQRNQTVDEIIRKLVVGVFVGLVVWGWRFVGAAFRSLWAWLPGLRSSIQVETWQLLSIGLLPLLLIEAARHLMRYRYRKDHFCGVDWVWAYSFPKGRVIRVTAMCPVCHRPIPRPRNILEHTDNFLCPTCSYNSLERSREAMPRDWELFIQGKVKARADCACAQ